MRRDDMLRKSVENRENLIPESYSRKLCDILSSLPDDVPESSDAEITVINHKKNTNIRTVLSAAAAFAVVFTAAFSVSRLAAPVSDSGHENDGKLYAVTSVSVTTEPTQTSVTSESSQTSTVTTVSDTQIQIQAAAWVTKNYIGEDTSEEVVTRQGAVPDAAVTVITVPYVPEVTAPVQTAPVPPEADKKPEIPLVPEEPVKPPEPPSEAPKPPVQKPNPPQKPEHVVPGHDHNKDKEKDHEHDELKKQQDSMEKYHAEN